MMNRILRVLPLFVLTLIPLLSACRGGPPASYYSVDYFQNTAEVTDKATRAILRDKFAYQITDWEYDPDEQRITFSTPWNYRGTNVKFSRQGIRRRAWVDIRIMHVDEIDAGYRMRKDTLVKPGEESVIINPEVGNPWERAAVSVAVERDRNIDPRVPNAASDEAGDWVDAGADHQEAKEILAYLRLRLMRRKHEYRKDQQTDQPQPAPFE